MESSQILIMFIFSGICFAGGFLIGYSTWGIKDEEKGIKNSTVITGDIFKDKKILKNIKMSLNNKNQYTIGGEIYKLKNL